MYNVLTKHILIPAKHHLCVNTKIQMHTNKQVNRVKETENLYFAGFTRLIQLQINTNTYVSDCINRVNAYIQQTTNLHWNKHTHTHIYIRTNMHTYFFIHIHKHIVALTHARTLEQKRDLFNLIFFQFSLCLQSNWKKFLKKRPAFFPVINVY